MSDFPEVSSKRKPPHWMMAPTLPGAVIAATVVVAPILAPMAAPSEAPAAKPGTTAQIEDPGMQGSKPFRAWNVPAWE